MMELVPQISGLLSSGKPTAHCALSIWPGALNDGFIFWIHSGASHVIQAMQPSGVPPEKNKIQNQGCL